MQYLRMTWKTIGYEVAITSSVKYMTQRIKTLQDQLIYHNDSTASCQKRTLVADFGESSNQQLSIVRLRMLRLAAAGRLALNKLMPLTRLTIHSWMILCKTFHRRARDYIRLYMSSSVREGDDMLTYDSIESQRRKAKTHRNVGKGLERSFCIY
jgi:hypothetical protein